MRKKIRVATRGSKLAQAQTMYVVSLLERINTDTDYEIVTISTIGDRVTDKPLSTFRGMGVFVKEIQTALLTHEVDIAVHSLKDVPVDRPEELTLTCYPKRENPFDILLTRTGAALHELDKGAVIGTSSARRALQLRAIRNDLEFRDIRGNLDTRIRKLFEGMYDGIVVAAAGMNRLGKEFSKSSLLPMSICLPSAGQGALVLECRADDFAVKDSVEAIDDYNTRYAVCAERTFLREFGGNCTVPVAAYATVNGSGLQMKTLVADPDTGKIVTSSGIGNANDYEAIGLSCADEIRWLASFEGINGIIK